MKVSVDVAIKGSKDAIWRAITDIENSADRISGIQQIEVLENPDKGFVGFKWRETRIMFGKEATEVMWVTDAQDYKGYKTRAESHGAIYISTFLISEREDHCVLTMGFESQAVGIVGKLMDRIFGNVMKKATEKDLLQDLKDIKTYVEEN